MENIKKSTLFLFLLILSLNANAQKYRGSQDSIKVFYDTLFNTLKEGYLYKDKVNWKTTQTETLSNLAKYTDFKKSLNEIKPLFSKIGADHCTIEYQGNAYNISAIYEPTLFSDQWKKKYATKPDFEVKLIDGKYGYILIPALNFSDTKPRNVNKIAQQLYDQIATFKNKNETEGWIIDLRFNTGGNSWPMLLALYDLLGDNKIASTLDVDKKLIKTTSLSKGEYQTDSKKIFQIKPNGKLLDHAKVALITGVVTASSGEVVAMAFKGRPNSILIGENSAGFTSANYGVGLPFGALMRLTKEYNSDRNGNYYDKLIPDIVVSKQDNFDDLMADKNIQEAIKFIKL